MERKTTPGWPYGLAGGYVVATYTFVFLSAGITALGWPAGLAPLQNALEWITLLLPLLLGLVNWIGMLSGGSHLDRTQLLNCTVLVKYGLIPFYLLGGGMIALLVLFSFTPVPFMIFMGPMAALMLGVAGWTILVGAAPFSIAYLVKAHKDGLLGTPMTVLACILQFFFVADVVCVMAMALKEKRWRKWTIAIAVLLALLLIFISVGLSLLIVALVSASMQ